MVTIGDLEKAGKAYDAARKQHRKEHSPESLKALDVATKEYDRVAFELKKQRDMESSY
jgi:hypothetical protein